MILPKEASKSILILNNNIPEDQKRIWVTIPEIRDRPLVAAGVDRNLSDDHVLHAITRFNNDVFLTRWHDSGVAYYRSPEYVNECPHQQRWKESGLLIEPPPNQFYILLSNGMIHVERNYTCSTKYW